MKKERHLAVRAYRYKDRYEKAKASEREQRLAHERGLALQEAIELEDSDNGEDATTVAASKPTADTIEPDGSIAEAMVDDNVQKDASTTHSN